MRRILLVLESGRTGVAADMLRGAIGGANMRPPADDDDPWGDCA